MTYTLGCVRRAIPALPGRLFAEVLSWLRTRARLRAKTARIRSTTVICVRRNGQVVMAADGQVTLGDHVLKHSAKKIRRLYQDKILAGFAGSTADAFNRCFRALNPSSSSMPAI